MTIYNGSSKEYEDSFILHTKVAIRKNYFQVSSDGHLSRRQATKMMFLLAHEGIEPLSTEIIRAYEQEFRLRASQTGDIFSIVPNNDKNKILIYSHETGPEVFLLPIASFVALSVASGVVGNLAYDALKGLYHKSRDSLKRIVRNWNEKSPENKIDEEEMQGALEIQLITPDGSFAIRFEEDKGISPELVEYLNRKIKYYQKNYTGK